MKFLLIFLGGGLGSVMRYYLGKLITTSSTLAFPFATLSVNVFSSFILGLLAAYTASKLNTDNLWLFLAVGFCGGFSTFSAFSLEVFQFIKNGMIVMAVLNILLSVVACVTALWIGYSLVSK